MFTLILAAIALTISLCTLTLGLVCRESKNRLLITLINVIVAIIFFSWVAYTMYWSD